MKLLDKIKSAIFEDEELDEEVEETKKEEKPKEKKKDDIVKKIDIEKTIPKRINLSEEIKEKEETIPKVEPAKRELRRTPVIFDEEDFVMEEVNSLEKPKIEVKKEESKKSLYGGYRDEKAKEKFRPSPVISPVYGFVGVSPVLEQAREDTKEKHFFVQDKKPEMSLDAIRQKAFGDRDEDDDLGLLYEMKKEDDAPAISKITLGDAEEYFEDLGLEYNVDYKDEAKEKKTLKEVKEEKVTDDVSEIEEDLKKEVISDEIEEFTLDSESKIEEITETPKTRSTKNKKLSEEVENESKLESTKELEITKEQLKPKSAKEIKKVKKIEDSGLGMLEEKEEDQSADEKNLYDLIDMMYDQK